jgi:SAM-dependent methyltransferase
MSRWPRFTQPLEDLRSGRPEPYIEEFLVSAATLLEKERKDLKVLDVGCGRGDRVAWLLAEGWNAYGADVEYVQQGERWLDNEGFGAGRLRVINNYRLPFEQPFDIVLSYQVLEHVPDLDLFLAGIVDISRKGTLGLHICPGAWRPIEPHMKTPIAHWFPKGPSRRAAIRTAVTLGLANGHFAGLPTRERARLYADFSEQETFWRRPAAMQRAFRRHNIQAEFNRTAAEKLSHKLSRLPGPVLWPISLVYGSMWACYVKTTQLAPMGDPVGGHRVLREYR